MIKNSADADDEQWDIYDNEEKPPQPSSSPASTLNTKLIMNMPVPPKKPKRPAPSFAFFLGDALKKWKKESLNNPNMKSSERTKIIAERWSVMSDEEKQKYKDRHTQSRKEYTKALNAYEEDLAKFHRENPGIQNHISTKDEVCTNKKQKHPISRATDGTPIQKPKKGELQYDHPLHASKSRVARHTVKKDPAELEELLGKLAGDHQTHETPYQVDDSAARRSK